MTYFRFKPLKYKFPKRVEYRKISDDGIRQWQEILNDSDISAYIRNSSSDINGKYDKFLNTLTAARDKCIPIIKRRFNRYKDKFEPWIMTGILRSIKVRDRLHKNLHRWEV